MRIQTIKGNTIKGNTQPSSGFSLLETMVTMSLSFVILFGVYVMTQHYGDTTKTEHSRMKLQQESRFMVSSFADELKDAGSVLTLSHTASFLGGAPFFNGVYPLNSNYFPDGIILATGDPAATTVLTQDFNPGDTVLKVEDANVPAYDPSNPFENPLWTAGDKGIVIGKTGYYVFSVSSADPSANTITLRSSAVYYSGLLQASYYYEDIQGGAAGNTVVYPVKAPVIRLTNFSIYLFRELDHPKLVDQYDSPQRIRQLIRLTDANNQEDPFAEGSTAEFSLISENIWDMQIAYIAYDDFSAADPSTTVDPAHHYFAGGNTSASLTDLLTDIRGNKLKQLDITVVALTDQLGGEGKQVREVPAIGDSYPYQLPERKLSFRIFTFSVELRNFNLIL